MTDIRMVIGALAATLLVSVIGIIWLANALPARTIPDVLQNIAVGSLTALAGVLTGRATAGRRRRVRNPGISS